MFQSAIQSAVKTNQYESQEIHSSQFIDEAHLKQNQGWPVWKLGLN